MLPKFLSLWRLGVDFFFLATFIILLCPFSYDEGRWYSNRGIILVAASGYGDSSQLNSPTAAALDGSPLIGKQLVWVVNICK